MWGQDKAIVKQSLFSLSQWTLPDRSKLLVPKDEGYGVMLIQPLHQGNYALNLLYLLM